MNISTYQLIQIFLIIIAIDSLLEYHTIYPEYFCFNSVIPVLWDIDAVWNPAKDVYVSFIIKQCYHRFMCLVLPLLHNSKLKNIDENDQYKWGRMSTKILIFFFTCYILANAHTQPLEWVNLIEMKKREWKTKHLVPII